MNVYLNMVLVAAFVIISVLMLVRWFKVNKKVMIADQAWSTLRMIFLAFGLLSMFLLVSSSVSKSGWDTARLVASIALVTVYMLLRDGVGEEGIVAGGKLYPWKIVRAYDWEERKKVIAVYFTVESTNKKKPDEYSTKELDFALEDKEVLMKFLKLNAGRKFQRMKKK